MKTFNDICQRCGKRLDSDDIVWLDLNWSTHQYSKEQWPEEWSQGGFSFGSTCAKRVLANNGISDMDLGDPI